MIPALSKNVYKLLKISPFESFGQITAKTNRKKLRKVIQKLTDSAFVPMPVIWQEKNRYLPREITENPGMFKGGDVPHWVEPLNRFHPDDETMIVVIMKSVQAGCTVSVGEGAMGFFTRYKLGSCAMFTASKTIGKIRSSSALDVLIDHSGLAKLLSPLSKRSSRKTADTAMYKEFVGGIKWLISSYNSISDMKSVTYGFIFGDEFDECPGQIGGQGDPAGLLAGRTMAVRMSKQLYISTPSTMDSSRIYAAFIEGDQRRYFAPCPHCGEKQTLIFKSAKDDHGLTFGMMTNPETEAKELDRTSVRYICKNKECQKDIPEEQRGIYPSQKMEMLQKGEWIPTWRDTDHVPNSPNHKSYHAPGMISPYLPWWRICQSFIDTKLGKDLEKLKDFTINILGEPWARVQSSSNWEKFKDRADDYVLGEVPDGGLIVLGAVDVQGDRLELGCYAFGGAEDNHFEKWLVDYQIFYGNPSNPDDECWDALSEYAYTKTFNILGAERGITKVAIDTGWDPKNADKTAKWWDSKSHTVFDFVSRRTDIFVAIQGSSEIKGGAVVKSSSNQHVKGLPRWDISTPIIKELFMMVIDYESGPNAIHFPKWTVDTTGIKRYIGDNIFKQMMSERYQEIRPNEFGWKKIHTRNEVWDISVYCQGLAYVLGFNKWETHHWEAYKQQLIAEANN